MEYGKYFKSEKEGKMILSTLDQVKNYSVDDIMLDEQWNTGDEKELKIHSIHPYPAKFPAFITTKALKYAQSENIQVTSISDVFCGCGTVALEAKMNNIDFWGCDINPVATLIARVKSSDYKVEKIQQYYAEIIKKAEDYYIADNEYDIAKERLQYWFKKEQYLDLLKYLRIIKEIRNTKYKNLFKCIFSSSLKPTSKWLLKSIKPQIDPNKEIPCVQKIFDRQYTKFLKAYIEKGNQKKKSSIEIEQINFLHKENVPLVDLIVTSPPYVTSYEYADLHQLSSLWLDYTNDFRELRKGSIGSVYNCEKYLEEKENLNHTAKNIVQTLKSNKSISKSRITSIERYYSNMQETVKKCYKMLHSDGMALFVIGDTEYKGTKVENSRHLSESLIANGFSEVKIVKRKISNKLLTPYRDSSGKFSSDKSNRTIYHEEFVIIGRKKNA